MMVVLFEVTPAPGQRDAYLHRAAALRPALDLSQGFLEIERFQSLANPDKILSLSAFTDEAALMRWRTLPEHRAAQAAGRAGLFADYRLRVAQVVRHYGLTDRTQAPADSRAAHDA